MIERQSNVCPWLIVRIFSLKLKLPLCLGKADIECPLYARASTEPKQQNSNANPTQFGPTAVLTG